MTKYRPACYPFGDLGAFVSYTEEEKTMVALFHRVGMRKTRNKIDYMLGKVSCTLLGFNKYYHCYCHFLLYIQIEALRDYYE